ncbi:MAG TPA: hydrogenase iron-sulfur subunit, partial [Desulfatirhabdiaceae bacterium]|nr:hydrogenase iron-sulfur subunit [Desulfatirhabdiaceae bacterium]
PFLLAFCCGRSAIPSQKLALAAGHILPVNLLTIEVPCAGSISIDYLLSAFSQQADGVLVLTCHEGNCHSERGNRYARQRVDSIAERLTIIGVNPARLQLTTIAANMPTEFFETVTRFEQQIIQLNQVKS